MKITVIGLGKMGTAIAEKLLEAGFSTTVYNRTVEKIEPLQAMGAKGSNRIEDAVKEADIILTSLLNDDALMAVSNKMLPYTKKEVIHISTSTILPDTAHILEQHHAEKGAIYLGAPVLGVPNAVRSKQATTICAGNKEAFEKVKPVLESFSKEIQYLGLSAKKANVLKICLNYSLVTAIELISELYAFAEKSDLETEIIQESLKHIYAHPAFHLYIDKIFHKKFNQVNFDMRGGNKDTLLFQKAFQDVGVSSDIASAIQGKFTQALSCGMAERDWSEISTIIYQRSGIFKK